MINESQKADLPASLAHGAPLSSDDEAMTRIDTALAKSEGGAV